MLATAASSINVALMVANSRVMSSSIAMFSTLSYPL
jgi:hypothetical protein